jgi:hypothetical protein
MPSQIPGLIQYDQARRALASALNIVQVKEVRNRATALVAYARQAGDTTLQNQAAELRLYAERRAGELLTVMEKSGERQAKQRGRRKDVSRTTTLPELGISRDQSSKWQTMYRKVDDATFERALAQAKEKGELTTAAVIRELKSVLRPPTLNAEPNINVVADDITRDLESTSRRERLDAVVCNKHRLNPAIRKKLIAALKEVSSHSSASLNELASGFQDFPSNKSHQRHVRDMAEHHADADTEIAEKRVAASSMKNAFVKEISHQDMKNIILAAEFLGSTGTVEYAFGLFFRHPETGKEYIAGAVCFGRVGGTRVAESVCGAEHRHRVTALIRGANLFWSHPHSGSHLVATSCKMMAAKGHPVVVAFADPTCFEQGVIYRAANFKFCGKTSPSQQYQTPDGKVHDSRQISGLARDRRGGVLRYKRTRAEQRKLLEQQGCVFLPGVPKLRFVLISGDRRTKRTLTKALRWKVAPFPKRKPVTN